MRFLLAILFLGATGKEDPRRSRRRMNRDTGRLARIHVVPTQPEDEALVAWIQGRDALRLALNQTSPRPALRVAEYQDSFVYSRGQ